MKLLTWAAYLIACHSLLMFVVLSKHVSKTPPGGCIGVVNAQGLTVTLLSSLPPHLPLRSPQVAQVVVHINLATNMSTLTEVPLARPGCSFMHHLSDTQVLSQGSR